MPIQIKESADPLSEQSLRLDTQGKPLLVESTALRVLRQELKRYCQGLIAGRSFLISGHRGAGKTTLVASAVLDIWKDCEVSGAVLRPLFIPLHGPSLFAIIPEGAPGTPPAAPVEPKPGVEGPTPTKPAGKTPDAKSSEKTAEKSTDKAGDKSTEKPEKTQAQIALEQIILGLHRAVAREFSHRYSERVRDLVALRRAEAEARARLRQRRIRLDEPDPAETSLERVLRALPPDVELHELAAQLEAELYEGPSPQRLYEFWARVHSVSGGVLFERGAAPSVQITSPLVPAPPPRVPPPPPAERGLREDWPEVHEQGMRELAALAGVVEAYRRISGEYKRTEQYKEELKREEERSTGFEAGKDLAQAAVALLTGGLAATGVAVSGTSAATTVASGLAAALGALFVFKMSTKRRRDRSIVRDYQFIFDLTAATLDRVLPILIERLRRAGLAPVFVVDELDKVDRLGKRLLTMVHHLKKLVAENAFFCFLTNRSYFEEMLTRSAGLPYPRDHTYYTHRLFVAFGPEDVERYLRQRIPAPRSEDPPDPVEDNLRAVLRWALRHRAQLHIVDLQREIAAIRGDNGEVPAAEVKAILESPQTGLDMTLQAAIELQMSQKDAQDAIMARHEFRRFLTDAMYYVTREWLAGAESVNLSEEGYKAFETYLERRTGREEERPNDPDAPTPDGDNGNRGRLSEKDCRFLFGQVQELADFLAYRPPVPPPAPAAPGETPPDWRQVRLARWNEQRRARKLDQVEVHVSDTLQVGQDTSFLERGAGEHEYTFRYPAPGVARRAPPGAPGIAPARFAPPAPSEWQPQADFLEEFRDVLARRQADPTPGLDKEPIEIDLETLGGRFAVFSAPYPWSVIEPSIRRLRGAAGGGPMAEPDDVVRVRQYCEVLTRNVDRIARALICAAAVGRFSGLGSRPRRLTRGLDVIVRAYAFRDRDEQAVGTALARISRQIRSEFGVDLPEAPLVATSKSELADYENMLRRTLQVVEQANRRPAAGSQEDQAWQAVQKRLVAWIQGGAIGDPEMAELFAAADQRGPATVLPHDPGAMIPAEWTALLARIRRPAPRGPRVPAWLGLFALHALGFRCPSEESLEVVARWLVDEPVLRIEGLDDGVYALIDQRRFLAGPLPANTVVLVKRTSASIFDALPVSPENAVLVATVEQLDALFPTQEDPMLSTWLGSSSARVVAVEMEPERRSELERRILPALGAALQEPWIVFAYPTDRGREMLQPCVVMPESVAAIVEAALRQGLLLPMYLASTRKVGAPVIRQLIPPPPYVPHPAGPPTFIRVIGESLSPRAQVRLNGMLLSPEEVQAPARTEGFVTELVLQPGTVVPPARGVRALKIINPDGQIAEF